MPAQSKRTTRLLMLKTEQLEFMKMKITHLILAGSILLTLHSCKDDSETPTDTKTTNTPLLPVDLTMDTVLQGLNRPWGFDFVDDNTIIFTDRDQGIFLWDGSAKTVMANTPAASTIGQGGYMDIVRHPDFDNNSLIYFSMSRNDGGGASTALYRAKFIAPSSFGDVQLLFQAEPKNSSGAHFGSRIVFDGNGYVYLSLGERNSMQTAQQTTNHNGSVIRIMEDGSIPDDNPFSNDAPNMPEIWTYGHRNVQGMAIHPETGEIWTHEHGPRGGDEINILQKGANYGWPLASYGINYNGDTITKDTFVEGTIAPIYYWVPSIAPCGMTFYWSDSIPQWKGDLFLGALAGQHLNHLEVGNDEVLEEERMLEGLARFRAVRQGPDGYLYFATENPGMIRRYKPAH